MAAEMVILAPWGWILMIGGSPDARIPMDMLLLGYLWYSWIKVKVCLQKQLKKCSNKNNSSAHWLQWWLWCCYYKVVIALKHLKKVWLRDFLTPLPPMPYPQPSCYTHTYLRHDQGKRACVQLEEWSQVTHLCT